MPGPLSLKLTSTFNPASAATLAAQPQRLKAGVTREASLQSRAPFVGPLAPSALNRTQPVVVPAGPPAAQLRLDANGRDVRPPVRVSVTLEHVQAALASMPGNIAGRLGRGSLRPPEDLYKTVTGFGHTVQHQSDLRFNDGIELKSAGRALLAGYYTRKYQANITFNDASAEQVFRYLPGILAHGRQQPGDEVRCAHYFGEKGGQGVHGSVLVYLREGGENGEEALMYFDSGQLNGDFDLGSSLASACKQWERGGRSIPVVQHTQYLQRDSSSCWVYAMKAATTLTGRRRDGAGGHGDFLIPDLIATLASRAIEATEAPGVFQARALPEIARMAQSEKAVLAHAGGELNRPLMVSKHAASLQGFLEKYTYDLRDNGGKGPHQMMDYMRQKGERLAEIVEIEAFSQQIGQALGEGEWGAQQQDLFATQMKKLVRVRHEPLSVDQEIEKLMSLGHDPEAFIVQAMKTADQLDAVTTHLTGNPGLAALLVQLSTAGLDELEQHFENAERRMTDLSGTFAAALEGFDDLYQARQLDRAGKQAYKLFWRPLRAALEGAMEDLLADKLLLARERIRRRTALADQKSFMQRPDKLRVVDAIAEIPDSSISQFHVGAKHVFEGMDRTKIQLAAPGVAGPSLRYMTYAELDRFKTDLDLHQILLQRLNERCSAFLLPLIPDPDDYSTSQDTEDEEDEEDLGGIGVSEAYLSLQSLCQAHEERMTGVRNDRALLANEVARRARAAQSSQQPAG